MKRSMILLVLFALAAGCNKSEQPAPAAEAADVVDPTAAFNALFEQARAYYHEGDTDSAVDLLTEGLADPQFVDNQSAIFRALVELLLREDRIVDAQTNFLAMLHASPEIAAQAFGMIPLYLKRQDDAAAYLGWTEQMIKTDLPEGVAETAYTFYVDANVQAGSLDVLDNLTRECIARFGGAGAVRVLTRPLNDLLKKQEYTVIQKALVALSGTGDPAALAFVTGTDITIAAAQGQWDKVVRLFKEKGLKLPDTTARLTLRAVAERAIEAQRSDVVDQLCEYIIASMPAARGTRAQAVSVYLDAAKKAGKYDNVVARLKRLKNAGAEDSLKEEISRIFYDVMNKASDGAKRELIAMLDEMLDAAPASSKSQLQGLLMDGAVLTSNYALALKVLDGGFRADEKNWVSMARNKLGAHLALQEGRVDDAVRMFRDFMKHVATWTTTTVDPSTGITYTREMSLGFNAKRIGDIYREAGRGDDAAKAYAEARDYFKLAMKTAEEDSKEEAYIKEQMAAMPSATPTGSM